MKAYLIDPEKREITVIDHDDSLNGIYEAIQAKPIDTVQLNRWRDVAFIDDEGLYRSPQFFWRYQDYPNPIAGKALVLGTTSDGNSREPVAVNTYSLAEDITWLTPEEALDLAREAEEAHEKAMAERAPDGFHHIHMSSVEIMEGQEYTVPPDKE